MRPYISFVIYTRNDDYAGGLTKCRWGIQYLAQQCDEFGLDAELVLVEWNPPSDRAPLAEVLGDIAPSNRLSVRIVTVPPDVHLRYRHAQIRHMHVAVAANVGLRRARGLFCVCKAADSYYSDSVVREFSQRKLEAGYLYRIERWDVAESVGTHLGSPRRDFLTQCSNSVIARHEHLPQAWTPFSLPDLFGNAAGDFQLMAADSWHAVRGNIETKDTTAFEIDSLLAYSAYAQGIRERRLPLDAIVYKIAHGSSHAHRLSTERDWLSRCMLRLEGATRQLPLRRMREFWMRAILNYPRKMYGGLSKPAYERSLIKYKLLSAVPQLDRLKSDDWGLSRIAFPECTILRAAWDQPQAG